MNGCRFTRGWSTVIASLFGVSIRLKAYQTAFLSPTPPPSYRRRRSFVIAKLKAFRFSPIAFAIISLSACPRHGWIVTWRTAAAAGIHASPYLFGWEMATRIGTAVLRLPPELAVLHDLNKFTDAPVAVPPWWPLKGRLKQHVKGLIGRHRRAEYMDWGTFGPKALTHFLSRRDLAGQALPVETFYPISWTDVSLFFAMPDAVSPRLTAKTIGVHLWSASIVTGVDGQKARGTALPPANSWLGAICERYGIAT